MTIASPNVMETSHNHGYRLSPMEPGQLVKKAREERGWSQEELARRVHISQVAIKKIEAGQTRQSKFLPQIATVLDIEINDLYPSESVGVIPRKELLAPGTDFPIHAAAEGGAGSMIVSSDAIDFMPRPAPLVHVREAYGILIVGTSMEPEFRQGDTALVNPHLPPMAGEPHVFYAEKDGTGRATIKTLRRSTGDNWLVSQHNPPEDGKHDFSLSRREWQWAHRVIGSYKRR